MRTLSVDIETYSSVSIKDCGAYKYAESSDFEILLFGYSVDFAEPEVIDIAQGEDIPLEIVMALFDPNVTKTAFNAQFEWICLSKYFGLDRERSLQWIRQWRDTMIHAYYLGYAGSLEMVGKAVGLPEDKQKLSIGKALIRYFSCPVKPTKSNGQRTRNYPHHDPEKWNLYKEYNRMDVVSETNILQKLMGIPVPEFIWEQWFTDIKINSRGVPMDHELIVGAIECDRIDKEKNMQAFRALTGLANPASNAQLLAWLHNEGLAIENMQKATITDTLKRDDLPENIRRALELKQEVSKTSIRKFSKMLDYECADGRARGILQFYGASTTGRYCLTGDHEVLTPFGWKRLDEWTGGLIAVWNPTSEVVSFQKSKALSFPYTGEMIEYSDVRLRQISTPDHKMYCKRNPRSGWETLTVEEMTKSRPVVPFFGYRQTVPCGISDNELRVLIMVQADGNFKEDGYLVLHFTKDRKAERCKRLLRRAGIVFSYSVRESKTDPKPQHYFRIARRNQPLSLRMFRDKTFGWWLLNENADTFFDELPNWDGYSTTQNSMQYSTVNKQNADIIQALAHMSGRACSMLVKKANGVTHKQDAYILNIWLHPTNQHELRCEPKRVQFDGTVYCAETSTGFFMVRRNGRVWVTGNSGRGIQLQNLKRCYLSDLDTPRELVKQQNYAGLNMFYESVSDTLSQLIRTAFIPAEGEVLLDADFSAIEARVIAWLAGEDWVLEEFRGDGKIYEATASQMFGVPKELIKKGSDLYKLRQQGKVSQLACIAENELVLTDKGLVPIQDVTTDMKVWDGEDWVSHEGAIYKGEKDVIEYEGLRATEDHLVWDADTGKQIPFGQAAKSGSRLVQSGSGGGNIRVTKDLNGGTQVHKRMEFVLRADRVYRMRRTFMEAARKLKAGAVNKMPEMFNRRKTAYSEMARQEDNCAEAEMHKSSRPELSSIRRSGNRVSIQLSNGVRATSHGIVPEYRQIYGNRSDRHKRALRKRKPENGYTQGESGKQKVNSPFRVRSSVLALRTFRSGTQALEGNDKRRDHRRCERRSLHETKKLAGHQRKVRVYDIRNAGPHHRFTVSGKLVHNCSYGGGVNAITTMDFNHEIPDEMKPGLVEQWRESNPNIVRFWYKLEKACKDTIKTGASNTVNGKLRTELVQSAGIRYLRIVLPNGRAIYYCSPHMTTNRFGNESIGFMGKNQVTGKWEKQETYSGKLAENVTQSVARDLLAESIERLEAEGFHILFHIHDEVVITYGGDNPEEALERVYSIMSFVPSWAEGLPMAADGWIGMYFKKD